MSTDSPHTLTTVGMEALPDARGRFGLFGGKYVPETLMSPLEELEHAYREARDDPAFDAELQGYLKDYVGRPTRSTSHAGSASTWVAGAFS